MKPHLMAQITRKEFSKNENNKKQPERKKTMKNTNFKTKLIARIMLLVLLLASALSFAGCGRVPQGYYDPYDFNYNLNQEERGSELRISAVSNTDIFDINDISFNLLLGTHANKYIGRQHPKGYEKEHYLYYSNRELKNAQGGEYVFALYISDIENLYMEQHIADIANIENYEYILSINEEVAFSEEYGYIVENWFLLDSFLYNHIESITIPSENIRNDIGSFVVHFVCYIENYTNNCYDVIYDELVIFDYQKIDEKTVHIDFGMENKR